MTLQWFPERLNAAILESFRASLGPVAADAQAHSGSRHAGAEVVPTGPTSAVIKPTGIGAIREEGARPHVITAKKGVLYLSTLGAFVSGEVHHPGSPAEPYIHPAAARWANGEFQGTARAVLASRGY